MTLHPDVHVSRALPIEPDPGEWARRFIRHGMADVLTWLHGTENTLGRVGPTPDTATHIIATAHKVLISREIAPKLRVVVDMRTGLFTLRTWADVRVPTPWDLDPAQLDDLPARPGSSRTRRVDG